MAWQNDWARAYLNSGIEDRMTRTVRDDSNEYVAWCCKQPDPRKPVEKKESKMMTKFFMKRVFVSALILAIGLAVCGVGVYLTRNNPEASLMGSFGITLYIAGLGISLVTAIISIVYTMTKIWE